MRDTTYDSYQEVSRILQSEMIEAPVHPTPINTMVSADVSRKTSLNLTVGAA